MCGSPACVSNALNAFRKFAGSSAVPIGEVKTKSLCCHASPRVACCARCAAWCRFSAARANGARRTTRRLRFDLGGPTTRPTPARRASVCRTGECRLRQIHVLPLESQEFSRTQPSARRDCDACIGGVPVAKVNSQADLVEVEDCGVLTDHPRAPDRVGRIPRDQLRAHRVVERIRQDASRIPCRPRADTGCLQIREPGLDDGRAQHIQAVSPEPRHHVALDDIPIRIEGPRLCTIVNRSAEKHEPCPDRAFH